jgi:hypothetical protein
MCFDVFKPICDDFPKHQSKFHFDALPIFLFHDLQPHISYFSETKVEFCPLTCKKQKSVLSAKEGRAGTV